MKNYSTVNDHEIDKFTLMAEDWWNVKGKMKPLHDMHKVRFSFIVDMLSENFFANDGFSSLKLIDVGCGGGILSESLASTGAYVVGIDASEKAIGVAKSHAKISGVDVKYMTGTVEDFFQDYEEYFDACFTLEVVEHVNNLELFLRDCVNMVKDNGLFFVSTINKNLKSLFLAKMTAEYILKWLPIGTHDWHKFVKPSVLIDILGNLGFYPVVMKGISYSIVKNNWYLSDSFDMNYIICFKKRKS